ncbi:hypothetical protein SNEBB_001868 [Seison nebaliae]|nr:hypothetical protein SNEBB_001868 [Seison nebaliae]
MNQQIMNITSYISPNTEVQYDGENERTKSLLAPFLSGTTTTTSSDQSSEKLFDIFIYEKDTSNTDEITNELVKKPVEKVKCGGRFIIILSSKNKSLELLDISRKLEYIKNEIETTQSVNYVLDVIHEHLDEREKNVTCVYEKREVSSKKFADHKSFQHFLDHQQYKMPSILKYEFMFGEGFVSTGGKETTEELMKKYLKNFRSKFRENRRPRLLDVGCGIGGGDEYLSKELDIEIVGIDLSYNMIDVARKASKNFKIIYDVADVMKVEYGAEAFDLIYSRDAILHIKDKLTLFQRFNKWLKPTGELLITDYGHAGNEWNDEFSAYVKQRGYTLTTPKEYGELLEKAGFKSVDSCDTGDRFRQVLIQEIKVMEDKKTEFIEKFDETSYTDLLNGWKRKVRSVDEKQQTWIRAHANKQ